LVNIKNAYLTEEISQWLKQTKVTKIPQTINNAPNSDKNINEIESKLSRDNRTQISIKLETLISNYKKR